LGDAAVDHHEAHGLLGKVVGRADAGGGDELEVGLAVFAEALGHVEGFALELFAVFVQARGYVVECGLHDGFAGVFHRAAKGVGVEVSAVVDGLEHLFDGGKQPLSVGFHLGVAQPGEILDITDQMGDAELHGDVEVVHVLVVGREVVAAEHAVELLAEHVD